jgi:hypothetical protein
MMGLMGKMGYDGIIPFYEHFFLSESGFIG